MGFGREQDRSSFFALGVPVPDCDFETLGRGPRAGERQSDVHFTCLFLPLEIQKRLGKYTFQR